MAELPQPEPGLVLSYAYLWRHEHNKGREEGRKARPAVIVLAVKAKADGAIRVTVAPITHSPPPKGSAAVELPAHVKRSLKLDDERSWVIVDEVNQFNWPGYDLRHAPGTGGRFAFGFIPPKLYDVIVRRVLEGADKGQVKAIPRD